MSMAMMRNIIMDTFYKKGVRQVIYLGTAGAIADYQVGDVVIPNEFIDRHNNAVSFEKISLALIAGTVKLG